MFVDERWCSHDQQTLSRANVCEEPTETVKKICQIFNIYRRTVNMYSDNSDLYCVKIPFYDHFRIVMLLFPVVTCFCFFLPRAPAAPGSHSRCCDWHPFSGTEPMMCMMCDHITLGHMFFQVSFHFDKSSYLYLYL